MRMKVLINMSFVVIVVIIVALSLSFVLSENVSITKNIEASTVVETDVVQIEGNATVVLNPFSFPVEVTYGNLTRIVYSGCYATFPYTSTSDYIIITSPEVPGFEEIVQVNVVNVT